MPDHAGDDMSASIEGVKRAHASDNTAGSKSRKTRQRALPLPSYKAVVIKEAETGPLTGTSSTAGIDQNTLGRIRKCLDLGMHKNTGEAEAKAALNMASRLMSQYNVSQADILEGETGEAQQKRAGHSIVAIQHCRLRKATQIPFQTFALNLAWAMRTFFACDYYTTKRSHSLEFSFYGIASNTAVAAKAFEMAYNSIVQWARSQRGVGSKNSYCMGASRTVIEQAKRARAQEEQDARDAERKKSTAGAQKPWGSHSQLMRFHKTAREIAEEYIKAQGFKIGKKYRKSTYRIRDWKAYDDGVKDGKTIDVHRKHLC